LTCDPAHNPPVHGKTAQRHTSADFIEFLSGVVRQTKWAKVNAARLVVFRRGELSERVVPLDEKETVGIILVLTKLNVTPLQRDQFALAQSGAESSEKKRIPFGSLPYLPLAVLNLFQNIEAEAATRKELNSVTTGVTHMTREHFLSKFRFVHHDLR